MATLTIRDAVPNDYATWRPLWDAYCDFYQARVAEDVTLGTWARIADPAGSIRALIADIDGKPEGFAAYHVHPCTWDLRPICYLEDLFVAPSARGKGVGRALVDDLVARARRNGWARLYWHTARTNATARKLYDRYAPVDDVVRYVVRF